MFRKKEKKRKKKKKKRKEKKGGEDRKGEPKMLDKFLLKIQQQGSSSSLRCACLTWIDGFIAHARRCTYVAARHVQAHRSSYKLYAGATRHLGALRSRSN